MFRKTIVSHLGEVNADTRFVGDTIRYRIYFDPPPRGSTLIITDHVDPTLSGVRVFNRGKYSARTHIASWTINPSIDPRRFNYVEFEAVPREPVVLRNSAASRLSTEGQPVTSNTVETTVITRPPVGWIPFKEGAKPEDPPRVYMKDETTTGTTVRFDVPGVFIYEECIDGVTYHHVELPGKAALSEIGKPQLPTTAAAIELPRDVKVAAEVLEAESVTLHGYNILPMQHPPIAMPVRANKFVLHRPTYQTDAFYPAEVAEVNDADTGTIRGHRIGFLRTSLVQYNPVRREIIGYGMIEARLNFDRTAQITAIDPRLRSKPFEELLEALLWNYKEPERFPTAGNGQLEKVGCDYLIIAADTLYQENDPSNPIVRLRNWKRQKGWKTKVVKVGSIPGGNDAASIRSYVQNAYNTWDIVPTFLLLVGDSDMVRAFPGVNHPDSNIYKQPQINTDQPYAAPDASGGIGAHDFPDILIGRLPADSVSQLTNVVDKILAYEKQPPATPLHDDFYRNISLISLCQDSYGNVKPVPNGRECFPWIATVESIRDYLQGQNYVVERIYATNSGYPNPNLPPNQQPPSPNQYQDGNPLPQDLLVPGYDWDGGTSDITQAFNDGRFLISYLAHGAPSGWSHPAFSSLNVPTLSGNDLTSVVFSITCQTGWFDNEIDDDTWGGQSADCFAEELLHLPRGGAVAVVSQTRVSYVDWNSWLELGMFRAVWPDFVPTPHWNTSTPVPPLRPVRLWKMGQIVTFGKMFMILSTGPDQYRTAQMQMEHLLGDPEMSIWVAAPHVLKVSHPAGIGSSGLQEFAVEVLDGTMGEPVLNATAVLTFADEIVQVAQTHADGRALFALNSPPAGDLTLTVTAPGCRPYEKTIVVSNLGAQINRLDPTDGPEGQVIRIGGRNFQAKEQVELHFADFAPIITTADASGQFGQAPNDVTLTVPPGQPHVRVNVVAHGRTSDRWASRIFQVRNQIPVDLYTYSQWAPSTWWLHPGDNPTWDSPDIQLYDDKTGNPVASNNLVLGERYQVKVNVRNVTAYDAPGATVVFRWRDYGADGPWNEFAHPVIDVPSNPPGIAVAEAPFDPPGTGHICIFCEIEHADDTDATNNAGQENLHVGYSKSPSEVCFLVYNRTGEPAPVHLEVRQLLPPDQHERRLWSTWVKHPEPQILQPGETAKACLVIDPHDARPKQGEQADFAVTAFIGARMIGGVNIRMIKQ